MATGLLEAREQHNLVTGRDKSVARLPETAAKNSGLSLEAEEQNPFKDSPIERARYSYRVRSKIPEMVLAAAVLAASILPLGTRSASAQVELGVYPDADAHIIIEVPDLPAPDLNLSVEPPIVADVGTVFLQGEGELVPPKIEAETPLPLEQRPFETLTKEDLKPVNIYDIETSLVKRSDPEITVGSIIIQAPPEIQKIIIDAYNAFANGPYLGKINAHIRRISIATTAVNKNIVVICDDDIGPAAAGGTVYIDIPSATSTTIQSLMLSSAIIAEKAGEGMLVNRYEMPAYEARSANDYKKNIQSTQISVDVSKANLDHFKKTAPNLIAVRNEQARLNAVQQLLERLDAEYNTVASLTR